MTNLIFNLMMMYNIQFKIRICYEITPGLDYVSKLCQDHFEILFSLISILFFLNVILNANSFPLVNIMMKYKKL